MHLIRSVYLDLVTWEPDPGTTAPVGSEATLEVMDVWEVEEKK